VTQQVKSILTGGALAVLTAAAIFFLVAKVRDYRGGGEAAIRVWFYDQNSGHLYAAPRTLIPPDGENEARVRAMVIGFQGLGNGIGQIRIAYLEKYSPEFKALLQRAALAHAAKLPFWEKVPSEGSAYYQSNAFVKRLDETSWHEAGTPEARQIVAEWHSWRGPNGEMPVISVP
jgi:hypothetical protein